MKICFIDGTRGFSPHRLESKPTGGINTSLTIIPRLLAENGHDVTVMSIHPDTQIIEGVLYTQNPEAAIGSNVVVFNRNCINNAMIAQFPNAKKILWLHDIVQFTYFQDDCFRHVDRIVALSNYCKKTYADFYDIATDRFVIIPNGVDRDVFYKDGRERNRNLYICASSPIKGLYPLEYIYSNMKRHNPDFELRLYCSQSLHDLEDDERSKKMLANLAAIGVKVLDPIPQHELAEVMREAYCLLMPNHYPEICSNLLLQAQACGLPVIATNIGSAPEFIHHGNSGLLTHFGPQDMFAWWKDCAELAAKLYFGHYNYERISRTGDMFVRSWTNIAALWDKAISKWELQYTQNTLKTVDLTA